MITPAQVIPPALMARLVALEARLLPLGAAMDVEAARVARIRASLPGPLSDADKALLLRTAGTDTERQYWASLVTGTSIGDIP